MDLGNHVETRHSKITAPQAICPDLDADGEVSNADYQEFLNRYAAGNCDLNSDDRCDSQDYLAFLIAYNLAELTACEDSTPTLHPGQGFPAGEHWEPMPIGQPGQPGHSAKVIARWDTVSYRDVGPAPGLIGVVAFHVNGIDRVEFSADSGPVATVRKSALNPESGVVEYFVRLDPTRYSTNRLSELRAVAYPKGAGIPRVLGGIKSRSYPVRDIVSEPEVGSSFVYVNRGDAPRPVAYVSPNGTPGGDGTRARPFREIFSALQAIKSNNGGRLDGGTVYLEKGDYLFNDPISYANETRDRYLTISAAPGVPHSDVRIVGGSTWGLSAQKIRLQRLKVTTGGAINTNIDNGHLWIEDVEFAGTDPTHSAGLGWHGGFGFVYVINSIYHDSVDGPKGSELVRGVVAFNLGQQPFSLSGAVINSHAWGIDARDSTLHPDVYMTGTNVDQYNIILYGLTTPPMSGTLGLLCGQAGYVLEGMAVIDSVIHGSNSQFIGTTRHLYMKNSIIGTGPLLFRDYRGDPQFAFTAENVVFENTRFLAHSPECRRSVILESTGGCSEVIGVSYR
ncbi:MAG: hypothetical protein AB7F66_13295 [Bacteriovoracia bacterium]